MMDMEGIEEIVEIEESTIDLKKQMDIEDVREAITKFDDKFERLIKNRKSREDSWTRTWNAVMNGSLDDDQVLKSLKKYTHFGGTELPPLFRTSVANFLSIFQKNWFRYKPTGQFFTDTQLTELVRGYQQQKLNSPHSGFKRAIKQAVMEFKAFGICALSYNFDIQLENSKTKRQLIPNENGIPIIEYTQEKERPLKYQGMRINFMSIFNVYLNDSESSTHNINELDLFTKEIVKLHTLKKNTIFDPLSPYINQNQVIFRDNMELLALEDNQDHIRKPTGDKTKQKEEWEPSSIELRKVFAKRIKIGEQVHENVCVYYAKSNDKPIPLLIEYNSFPFDQKPIFIATEFDDPNTLYAKSQFELVLNRHLYIVFLTALRAYCVGSSVQSSKAVNAKLYESLKGVSEEAVNDALNNFGRILKYNPDTLDPPNRASMFLYLNDLNKNSVDISSIDSEIALSKQAIQEILVDVSTPDMAGSTATGINVIASQKQTLGSMFRENFKNQVLEPMLRMNLKDMKELMIEETFSQSMSLEEETSFFDDNQIDQRFLEQSKADGRMITYPISTGRNIKEPMVDENGQPVIDPTTGQPAMILKPETVNISINPFTQQKRIALTQGLLQNFEADMIFELHGHNYDKTQELEKSTQLYSQLLQTVSNPAVLQNPLAMFLARQGIENHLTLTENEKKSEVLKKMDESIKASQAPNPQEEAMKQAQLEQSERLTQAKETESMSRAELHSANAEQKRLDNVNKQKDLDIRDAVGI